MKLIRIATKETDVLECGVVTGAGKITRTREWKIENREIGCEVERRRMSRPRLWQEGTVFVLHLTHWPSDAAKLTDYRAMAVGRGGEGGINGASREEKTGRLTEWGKREWGITALWMAGAIPVNWLAQSSTCMCMCVLLPLCGCDEQISANYEIKEASWWMWSTEDVAPITLVHT